MPRLEAPRGIAVIPLGSLDTADATRAPGTGPVRHIFAGSKAPWFEITDTLPQADET